MMKILKNNTPNYAGYVTRGGINGAIAGWMAAESGGINSDGSLQTNSDLYANNIGLGGVNSFLNAITLNQFSMIGDLTSFITSSIFDNIVNSTIGIEDIDISTDYGILITKVESNINIGGDVNLLTK